MPKIIMIIVSEPAERRYDAGLSKTRGNVNESFIFPIKEVRY